MNYRNVWLLNPRNFGDSDHHESFDLEEVANDVQRFIDEKQLTYVTVGGHGYGAKIACAFGSFYNDRTSGVICLDGGPLDHSYYQSWEEVKESLIKASQINTNSTSLGDAQRKIDQIVEVKQKHNYSIQNGEQF